MAGGKDDLNRSRRGPLGWFRELDRLLHGELTSVSALRSGGVEISARRLSACIIILAMIYGACMGTFALFRAKGPGVFQVVASMIKVPLLFYLTLLVTLPSLYVFNALIGSRLTLSTVVRLLVASVAVMVTVLASLGTIVAFFSVCTTSYPFMQIFNVAVFAISGTFGLRFLLQTLQTFNVAEAHRRTPPVSETWETQETAIPGPQETSALREPMPSRTASGHVQTVFQLWIIVFGLVGVQMAWVLRPFIGDPNQPFTWFRHRESNFFLAVFHALASLFS